MACQMHHAWRMLVNVSNWDGKGRGAAERRGGCLPADEHGQTGIHLRDTAGHEAGKDVHNKKGDAEADV